MTKTQIQSLFRPGQIVRVTNHYITRVDHPCYGTRVAMIKTVNNGSIHFAQSGRVAWPKADQLTADGSVVRFYGGGIGQPPTDLFLTIETNPDGIPQT